MTQVFLKHHLREPAACHDKLVALHGAALSTGTFTAPEPLRFLSDSGDSELSWLTGVAPLAETLPRLSTEMALDVVARVGRALAALHTSWRLAVVQEVTLPALLASAGTELVEHLRPSILDIAPAVLCHGDFGLGNVLWDASPSSLPVIVDPEPAPFLALPVAASCSPYLDVAHFVSCLEGVFPISLYPRYRWVAVPMLRERFVEAYERGVGRRLDMAQVKAVAACLLVLCGRWMVCNRGWLRAGVYRLWLARRAQRLVLGGGAP